MSGSVFDKLSKFLSQSARKQAEKQDKLRKLLAKMRKKQKKLAAELATTDDLERQDELNRKIRLLKEQRRRGLDHLAALKRGDVD